jgi:hypothetical protein
LVLKTGFVLFGNQPVTILRNAIAISTDFWIGQIGLLNPTAFSKGSSITACKNGLPKPYKGFGKNQPRKRFSVDIATDLLDAAGI